MGADESNNTLPSFSSLASASVEKQIEFFSQTFSEQEIVGLLRAFRGDIMAQAQTFSLSESAIDMCGTGGDK